MANGCPVGTIVMWGGMNNTPDDWLVCDGSIVAQADYADLFNVIGHYFGDMGPSSNYDPKTQFFLPDLRGRFVRGVDDTPSGRDPDRGSRVDMQSGNPALQPVGSLQPDDFKAHTHQCVFWSDDTDPEKWGFVTNYNQSIPKLDTPTSSTGGAETRPVNAYLYFIIKARSS